MAARGALHLTLTAAFGMATVLGKCFGPLAAPHRWLAYDRPALDLRFVRDNFEHSSLSTTSGYLHSGEDARHEATQERHQIPLADAPC